METKHTPGPWAVSEWHLIAAAPDLLAALESVVEAEFGYGAWPSEESLRAAIAKAKGEV